jgi:hypothetical protein
LTTFTLPRFWPDVSKINFTGSINILLTFV